MSPNGRIAPLNLSDFAAVHESAFGGHSNRGRECPLLDQSGQRRIIGRDGLSANDPTATLAVHCGNGFDAGFSPYQSARLSRYNTVC